MDGLRRGEALGTETRPRASGMTKSYPLTAKSCAVNTLCTVYAEEKALSHRHDEELSLDGDILPDECTMDGLRREAIGTDTRPRVLGTTNSCPLTETSCPINALWTVYAEEKLSARRQGREPRARRRSSPRQQKSSR
uniref:Uncharacterized protein n=1 Tax=Cacopsylla melanoneura TaxID=428564 RepID=A0A8D8WT36_9HEMI